MNSPVVPGRDNFDAGTSNLRPYSSPSSRSTSFSEVMMSVRGDPASCSFDANNGEAVASSRRL